MKHNRNSRPAEKIAKIIFPSKDDTIFELHTPYDHDFINAMKSTVPFKKRRWVPEPKIWVIGITYLNEIVKLCRGHFDTVTTESGEVHIESETASKPTQVNVPDEEIGWKAAETFILNAPAEALKTLYKECVKLAHPDHGGSDETMQKLNDAWEEIKIVRGIT